MDIPKLLRLTGFFAFVISIAIKSFKKDKYKNKNISEYVFVLFAFFLGATVSYPHYNKLIPIALWSTVSGGIAALIVEARRRN